MVNISFNEYKDYLNSLYYKCKIQCDACYVFGVVPFEGEYERVAKVRLENGLPLKSDEYGWFPEPHEFTYKSEDTTNPNDTGIEGINY